MDRRRIEALGIPIEFGAGGHGTALGPIALRAAGLHKALIGSGHCVADLGTAAIDGLANIQRSNEPVRNLDQYASWTRALDDYAFKMAAGGAIPVFLGGDHSLSAGTVAGLSRYAAEQRRELFVLWLDAHPDFHTFETSLSGNAHGTPAAFFCGLPGFDTLLGKRLRTPVKPQHVCMMGIRSMDEAEQINIGQYGVQVHDMCAMREHGAFALLRPFLDDVSRRDGLLHVSLDVDFLDPAIAPGVGTPVASGASYQQAHLIMEMLRDSELTSSLDIVELNPLLDLDGRTARLLVSLVTTLFERGTQKQCAPHSSMALQE